MEIAYKTFHSVDGELFSSNIHHKHKCFNDGFISLKYQPGELRRPMIENSKLFAFDTLENAKVIGRSDVDPVEIWECEAEEVEHPTDVIGTVLVRDMRQFWNGLIKDHERPCWHLSSFPGTLWCGSIRPIRVVLKA